MGNAQGRPVVITEEVNLDHFKLLRVVGKGAFGKVRIVERKDTGLTFALKYIRKDEIVRSGNVRNIVRERRMLKHLNHPFLCNLRYSFQDYEYLYLVVDLMTGGDLRFHISRRAFKEETVRFWIAELGCALRYIHAQGIVHRDVKPDNVLLDADGHVHLADFNVASEVDSNKPLTSKSGTLAYLAPEVYEGKGYFYEVDWWSLGVLFYECIYNRRPYEANSHEELSAKIRAATPKYPVTSPLVSTACTSAMKALMQKNLDDRIGANGFETFEQHPFLLPIEFDALERKEIEPIFIPSADKTNFDATYDLEELLLEESPLEARTRHQKPRQQLRPDATAAERREDELHRMIEQLFEPFDYTTAEFDKFSGLTGEATSLSTAGSGGTVAVGAMASVYSERQSRTGTPGSRAVSPSGTGSPPLTSRMSYPALSGQGPAQDASDTTPVVLCPPTPTAQSSQGPDVSFNIPGLTQSQSQPQTQSQALRPKLKERHSRRSSKAVLQSGDLIAPNTLSKSPGPMQQKAQGKERDRDKDTAGGGSSADSTSPKEKKSGFLSILSSKKGREKSPRRENGVLGREGARVIISEG